MGLFARGHVLQVARPPFLFARRQFTAHIVRPMPTPPVNDSLPRLEAAELLLEQTRLDLSNHRIDADTARGRLWCVIESLAHVARKVTSLTA